MNRHSENHNVPDRPEALILKRHHCLACGDVLTSDRRRYCTVKCRQHLHHVLNIRTGLLRALNVRYATFYFTDRFIVMDVLPYDSHNIYSFIYQRAKEQRPADDFRTMANNLGNTWWAEKKRTNRRYLASHLLFEKAAPRTGVAASLYPIEIKIPRVDGRALTELKIDRSKLNSPDLKRMIKAAYRFQAKISHPDYGGDAALFRKVHDAYEEIIRWVQSPKFYRRRGFPDKWFYDGRTNRWVQPTPCPLPRHQVQAS